MPKCTYFLMVWKLSGWSGNFLDDLETFRMIWKLSGWFGNFPNDLETFRMIWKLSDHLEPSGWFRNFPDGLEAFGWSGKCLDDLETFQRVWQLSRWSENILTNLPIHKFLQKRIYVNVAKTIDAKTIYALRPESFCALRFATRWRHLH